MCAYFRYSRAAYYKSLKVHEEGSLSESLILELIRSERCIQPRLGGKKLYCMLGSDIRAISPHFGRDKFFSLLRDNDLLVKRKRQYLYCVQARGTIRRLILITIFTSTAI